MTDRLTADPDVTTLILGGGRGSRMGGVPKAMLVLAGSTLLERGVDRASRVSGQVIVGLPSELVEEGRSLLGEQATVLSGGATRQQTLEVLLSAVETRLTVIHDVARPFASDALWARVVEAGRRHGAAAPMLRLQARDSLATIEGEWMGAPVDRHNLALIQTPYLFTTDELRTAVVRAKTDGVEETSITTLVTRLGGRIAVVEGEVDNTKITYQEDWDAAVLAATDSF